MISCLRNVCALFAFRLSCFRAHNLSIVVKIKLSQDNIMRRLQSKHFAMLANAFTVISVSCGTVVVAMIMCIARVTVSWYCTVRYIAVRYS